MHVDKATIYPAGFVFFNYRRLIQNMEEKVCCPQPATTDRSRDVLTWAFYCHSNVLSFFTASNNEWLLCSAKSTTCVSTASLFTCWTYVYVHDDNIRACQDKKLNSFINDIPEQCLSRAFCQTHNKLATWHTCTNSGRVLTCRPSNVVFMHACDQLYWETVMGENLWSTVNYMA